jgi:hypothetical protein
MANVVFYGQTFQFETVDEAHSFALSLIRHWANKDSYFDTAIVSWTDIDGIEYKMSIRRSDEYTESEGETCGDVDEQAAEPGDSL